MVAYTGMDNDLVQQMGQLSHMSSQEFVVTAEQHAVGREGKRNKTRFLESISGTAYRRNVRY